MVTLAMDYHSIAKMPVISENSPEFNIYGFCFVDKLNFKANDALFFPLQFHL